MSVMLDPSRCSAEVFDGWHFHQCNRKRVTTGGYCKQHDPEAVAKRWAARRERDAQKWNEGKRLALRHAVSRVLEAVTVCDACRAEIEKLR